MTFTKDSARAGSAPIADQGKNALKVLSNAVLNCFLCLLIVLPAAGIVLPVLSMLVCSFCRFWSSAGIKGITLRWYEEVFQYPMFLDSIVLSLKISLLSVLANNVIGLPFAYALIRFRFPGKNIINETLRLPIVIPGLVFALSLIISFRHLYGSWYLIFIASVVFSLPFYVETVVNALRAFDFVVLENAARTLGAATLKSHWLVLLPMLRVPVIIASATVFTISWSEFSISFLLASANAFPVSGLLYSAYTGTSVQFSSAASIVYVAVLVPFLILLYRYSGNMRTAAKPANRDG